MSRSARGLEIGNKLIDETIKWMKVKGISRVMIGGLDAIFGTELRVALQSRGFIVRDSEQPYRGVRPTNICNGGRSGQGIQLELSFAPGFKLVGIL